MDELKSPSWRQEAITGALPNGVISAAMAWLVFGGRTDIPVIGWGGIALDAGPQSGMIGLMTFLMAVVAVRRCRNAAPSWLPAALGRSLAIGLCIAVLGFLFSWVVLPLVAPPFWTFTAVFLFKVGYAVTLGTLLTGPALQVALRYTPRAPVPEPTD